jgi:DNA-binding CsgD family transcriptional regulator
VRRLLAAEKREAIAADLGITPRTVRFHLDNARRKVGASCTLALAVYFARRHPATSDSLQLELW